MKDTLSLRNRKSGECRSLAGVLTALCFLMACSARADVRSISRTLSARASALAENRLEIGVRASYFHLLEKTRREYDDQGRFTGGFLGSIDTLSEKQDPRPMPFARVLFNDWSGMQIGYASLGAKTSTFWDGHSDGTIELRGPAFELFARARLAHGFSPYAFFGIAPLRANFKHDDLWHNGFSPGNREAYDAWVAAGKPKWPNGGYRRTIALKDTIGWTLAAGCAYALPRRWSAQLDYRYMAADVKANYSLSWHGRNRQNRGNYTFPMSHHGVSLGVGYAF